MLLDGRERVIAEWTVVRAVQRPLVYTDFDRDHWVLVASPGELGRWPTYEARLREDVARVLSAGRRSRAASPGGGFVSAARLFP